ncbi:MAG: hypothetical protein IKM16_00045 [Clostridia bacterium]|nr:hypothetical protein [Clostridia bacterium]MBR7141497.1 hypothetical protein [Clostridia bacterium]
MLKKYLSAIIVAGAAVLALIFGLILPGATYTTEQSGLTVNVTVNLLGIMFGSAKVISSTESAIGNVTQESTLNGGMSIFGLISLIALIAGIALIVVSIFVKGKKFDFIGAICIAAAGVLIFLTLTCGTDVTGVTMGNNTINSTESFVEAYEGFSLGAGAIIYGIVATLGGAFGIVNNFKKLV